MKRIIPIILLSFISSTYNSIYAQVFTGFDQRPFISTIPDSPYLKIAIQESSFLLKKEKNSIRYINYDPQYFGFVLQKQLSPQLIKPSLFLNIKKDQKIQFEKVERKLKQ